MSTPETFWVGKHRAVAHDASTEQWTTACGLTLADDGRDPAEITPHPACGKCMGSEARAAMAAATRPNGTKRR